MTLILLHAAIHLSRCAVGAHDRRQMCSFELVIRAVDRFLLPSVIGGRLPFTVPLCALSLGSQSRIRNDVLGHCLL